MILILILFWKTKLSKLWLLLPPSSPGWLLCFALLPACNVYNAGLNPALWRAASFLAESVRPWDFFFPHKHHSLSTVSVFPLWPDFIWWEQVYSVCCNIITFKFKHQIQQMLLLYGSSAHTDTHLKDNWLWNTALPDTIDNSRFSVLTGDTFNLFGLSWYVSATHTLV